MEKKLSDKKVLFLNFSARINPGNCEKIMEHISKRYKFKETKVVNVRDLNYHPCSNCNYNCFFERTCPHANDDIGTLSLDILNYDVAIFLIPEYCGGFSALYQIFNERSQFYYNGDEYVEKQEKVQKLYVLVGNTDPDTLLKMIGYKDDAIVASNHIYGKNSIKGEITDSEEFLKYLDEFFDKKLLGK